ncbi:MAG: disulfide oxidoreductase, partial [Alphaproteobacteria bacterium]
QQLMLKPAPTRLRLVLWSLAKDLQEFPEAPPPGLVTVPVVKDAPEGYYAQAGYRLAGERAIRIDMLERLADMIRSQDTRAGFEGNADMLSITGLTLEQFANLMEGLGYKAERGERPKVKAVVEQAKPVEPTTDAEAPVEATEPVQDAKEEPVEPEVEVFYTFKWAPKRAPSGPRRDGNKGKPKGKPRGKGKREDKKQNFSARPVKKDKPIDPDNPFAALMALKDKS